MKLPSLHDFSRDSRLLMLASGLIAVGFFGILTLLRSLYLLRLGHDESYIGTFFAVGAITYMAMGVPSGALGTRLGTRRVMFAGCVITSTGIVLLACTQYVPLGWQNLWPMLSQFITIIGWSMFNVNMVPAVMSVTNDWNRNATYALNGALREVGTFLGSLIGGWLPELWATALSLDLDAPAPYSFSLWVGAALGITAAIPLSRLGRGKVVEVAEGEVVAEGAFPFWSIAFLVLYVYVRHAGWATCQAFCTPYMDTGLHLSSSTIGILTGVGQFAAIVAALLMPRLIKHLSSGLTLVVATVGIGLSLLLLAFVPHWAAAGLGRLGVLVLMAIWLPTLQVFQMERVSSRWRSLAYGALSMAMGLGFGSMSLLGGYLIENRGYASVYKLGAGLSFVAAVLLLAILRFSGRRQEKREP